MAAFTAQELLLVSQQNADCVRLLQLDDFWTSMAADARGNSTDALNLMISEMRPLIYRVAEQSHQVHGIAEEHIEEADSAVQGILSSDALSESDRTDLLWLLRRRGRDSPVEVLRGAEQALSDPKSEEGGLDQQLRMIAEGQQVTGDLSKKFRCGLGLSLIGGSILTLPGSTAAGFGVLALGGAGAAAVTGMFLTGGIGGVALLVAGLIVARRNGC